MVNPSEELQLVFEKALQDAKKLQHEYLTLEHLLFGMLCEEKFDWRQIDGDVYGVLIIIYLSVSRIRFMKKMSFYKSGAKREDKNVTF